MTTARVRPRATIPLVVKADEFWRDDSLRYLRMSSTPKARIAARQASTSKENRPATMLPRTGRCANRRNGKGMWVGLPSTKRYGPNDRTQAPNIVRVAICIRELRRDLQIKATARRMSGEPMYAPASDVSGIGIPEKWIPKETL